MWQEVLLSPNIKRFDKPKTAQAFCRFPWEESADDELKKKAEQYKITPEEEAELNKIFKKWEASKASKETTDEQDR